MFGSSAKTAGAVSIPATAPSVAASPHPSASIQVTRTPTSRASSGFDRRGAKRESDLRELEQQPEEEHDPERDDDRADVVRGHDHSAEVDTCLFRTGPRAAGARRPSSQMMKPVDGDEQPDRHDDDAQHAAPLDRADDRTVDARRRRRTRARSVATNAGQ